ncbi:MAG: hypothetical protein QME72_02450 [Rhodococcus sp. (in: high G+C Gram-positive bacteria)]|nr:hypothetical protein [Rhodococcus sp. (in: high G+C Gram-positive bacteria)]MDI6626561.1 hypothetical protein [Rhodococcus sp. (in: high G+C Gram-positive bacteria)]
MIVDTNVRDLSVADLDAALADTERRLMSARNEAHSDINLAALEDSRRRLLNEFRRRGL